MSIKAQRVVFTGAEKAEVEPFDLDASLGPDMVLMRCECSLISTGTELAYFTGHQDIDGGRSVSYPMYPGYASVGIVEAVGEEIKDLSPGDRVLAATAHSSHAGFKPADVICQKLSKDVSSDHATFIRMALIPLATMCTADLHAGEWLGVVGVGIVGNLGAQFGRLAGCRVLAVGRSSLRSRLAAECGITNLITGSPEEIAEQTRTITQGAGCRFVLETSGAAEGVLKAIALAADGGAISLVGVPWLTDSSTPATSILQPIFTRYLHIFGGWEWFLPRYERDPKRPLPAIGSRHSIEANARYAMEVIRTGELKVEPLITHRIRPSSIQEAYSGLLHKRNEYLGVIIDWE